MYIRSSVQEILHVACKLPAKNTCCTSVRHSSIVVRMEDLKIGSAEILDRMARLVGEEAVSAFERTRVFVFGLGGVGSWCAEALTRSGIGHLVLVDDDAVCASNINRQIEATINTIGMYKTDALSDRIRSINQTCIVTTIRATYSAKTISLFDIGPGDYVVDAIDSIQSKIDLAEQCASAGAVLFSSMGTALKLDPTKLRVADIWKTEGCPLARLVRSGLRKHGFSGSYQTVYSAEQLPRRNSPSSGMPDGSLRPSKIVNGSAVQVTATAGMILCSLVINDIISKKVRSTT